MPDARGVAFGKDRLREVIRDCAARPAADIAASIRDRLTHFRGDAKQVDDLTFVVIKVAPAPPK